MELLLILVTNIEIISIDTNKVQFEHHALPLDLAALNAEKIVRCAKSPEAKFKLLHKIYDKQKIWAVGSDINKINDTLIKIGVESKIPKSDLKECLDNEKSQETILKERIKAQKEYDITSKCTHKRCFFIKICYMCLCPSSNVNV